MSETPPPPNPNTPADTGNDSPHALEYQSARAKKVPKLNRPNPVGMTFVSLGFIAFSIWSIVGIIQKGPLDVSGALLITVLVIAALFCGLQMALLPLTTDKHCKKTLRKLYRGLRRAYSTPPDYRVISLSDVPRAPTAIYLDWTREFERQSFQHLGDFESHDPDRSKKSLRIAFRVLSASGGRHIATCYAFQAKLFSRILSTLFHRRSLFRSVAVSTQFSDGVFIETQFTPEVPGGISLSKHLAATVPWSAQISALVYRHQQRVMEYETEHPGTYIVPRPTLEDHLASLVQISNNFAAEKRARGYLTEDELPALFQLKNEAWIAKYKELFREILKEEAAAETTASPAATADR